MIWFVVTLTRIIIRGETYLYAELNDITPRVLAQRALKQSEERFRAIIETASDWIWEVDKEGKYTYCSPQVENILGYTADEMIGKSPQVATG